MSVASVLLIQLFIYPHRLLAAGIVRQKSPEALSREKHINRWIRPAREARAGTTIGFRRLGVCSLRVTAGIDRRDLRQAVVVFCAPKDSSPDAHAPEFPQLMPPPPIGARAPVGLLPRLGGRPITRMELERRQHNRLDSREQITRNRAAAGENHRVERAEIQK